MLASNSQRASGDTLIRKRRCRRRGNLLQQQSKPNVLNITCVHRTIAAGILLLFCRKQSHEAPIFTSKFTRLRQDILAKVSAALSPRPRARITPRRARIHEQNAQPSLLLFYAVHSWSSVARSEASSGKLRSRRLLDTLPPFAIPV